MGGGWSGEVVVGVAEVVMFRRGRPELVELKSSRHGKGSFRDVHWLQISGHKSTDTDRAVFSTTGEYT